jgi:NADH dehydrogenase
VNPVVCREGKKRVIIVGGGFGGVQVLKKLRDADADIVLIDRRNYHLFQPLLYQVATAALSPAQIAVPLRSAVETQSNCSVFMAEVSGVDIAQQKVFVGPERVAWSYDYLVLATGAETNYFGNNQWKEHAPGLKSIEEALSVRAKFLLAFEQAEMVDDPILRAELLTFVIVGGGPTGVELAGAMAEIAHTTLKSSFRRFDAATARVVLVDSGERLIKSFDTSSSTCAKKDLESLGVEVILNSRVTDVTEHSIQVLSKDGAQQTIMTRQVIWAAGVKASPLGAMLGAPLDNAGRVIVRSDLSISHAPNVFVIGDLASYQDPQSKTAVPGVAQGAIQMGNFVGEIIARELSEEKLSEQSTRGQFLYKDKGSMATIGRGKAVAEINGKTYRGLFAWILWAVIHVFFLIGFRNRIETLLQWIWMYFFYERGVRLITGEVKQDSAIPFPRDPKESLEKLIN